MKSSRIIEKVVGFMLVAFLLAYVGVQTMRGVAPSMMTIQTAHLSSVFQSVSGRGVVFRDEIALEHGGANAISSLFDDAVRVLVGEPVAELLSPGTYVGSRSLLRQTQWEIEMLEQAQNTSVHHMANTEAIGRGISQQMVRLSKMSATGDFGGVDDLRQDLTALLNQRQIATGREDNFALRINALENQWESLSIVGEGSNRVVLAPVTGFYSRLVDGLENILTLETVRSADIYRLSGIIQTTQPEQSIGSAGRIVTSHNWYVAIMVDRYKTQWVLPGQNLEMVFESNGARVPGVVERLLLGAVDDDYAVLVVHSNHVTGDTINLRTDNIRLEFAQHEGIRVDAAALRFVDGERGVFTMVNNTVQFRRVDPIYEEPGFLLSRIPHNPHDPFFLRLHDQVIIGGVELETRIMG